MASRVTTWRGRYRTEEQADDLATKFLHKKRTKNAPEFKINLFGLWTNKNGSLEGLVEERKQSGKTRSVSLRPGNLKVVCLKNSVKTVELPDSEAGLMVAGLK